MILNNSHNTNTGVSSYTHDSHCTSNIPELEQILMCNNKTYIYVYHFPVWKTLALFLQAVRASPGKGSGLRMRSPLRPRLGRSPPSPHFPQHPSPSCRHYCSFMAAEAAVEKEQFSDKIWLRPEIVFCSVKSKTAFAFLDFPIPMTPHGIRNTRYMAILAALVTYNPLLNIICDSKLVLKESFIIN